GETHGLGVAEHVDALFDAAPQLKLDYVVINSVPISNESKQMYAAEGGVQIGLDYSDKPVMISRGHEIAVVSVDVLDEEDKVRHAPRKLAQVLLEIYSAREAERQTLKYSD